MWCCCEPSAESMAKHPDTWLLVCLWVWDIGQPVLARRLLEVGSGQLWGWRGLYEPGKISAVCFSIDLLQLWIN